MRRFIPLLAGVMLLTGCAVTAGSGAVRSESRPVSGFSAVEMSGSGELSIEQTGTESLTIEAEDNILPVLTSEVSDGTLRLGSKTSLVTTKPIKYRLTLANFTGLSISGSGEVTAPKITTPQLDVRISGSGTVTVGGTADSQQIQISGSGNYRANGLASKVVTAQISGSGNADVMVADVLNAQISGSGTLSYSGDPATVTKQIGGSGELIKK